MGVGGACAEDGSAAVMRRTARRETREGVEESMSGGLCAGVRWRWRGKRDGKMEGLPCLNI